MTPDGASRGPDDAPDIWVLEDDPVDQRLIASAFINSGYAAPTEIVPTADELIRRLDAAPRSPALFLIDLNTPGLGGVECVRVLRSRRELGTVPIIVFTSSESERDRRNAAEAGANSFHVKPFDWGEFNRLVEQILTYWLRLVPRALPNG